MTTLLELYQSMIERKQLAAETPEGAYLERGFEMPLYLRRNSEPVLVKQVTIRDVKLPKAWRRQGQLRELVHYLLKEKKLAVQLECVVCPWLRAELERSPLWHRNSDPENKFNPSFARFPDGNFKGLFH